MSEGRRYRCPKCKESDGLWEGLMISGWRAVDEKLEATHQKEADWAHVEETGDMGCSCGWEGWRSALEALGVDDEPLPVVIPGQLAIPTKEG